MYKFIQELCGLRCAQTAILEDSVCIITGAVSFVKGSGEKPERCFRQYKVEIKTEQGRYTKVMTRPCSVCFRLFVIVKTVTGLAAIAALIVLLLEQIVAYRLFAGLVVLRLHHQEIPVNAG